MTDTAVHYVTTTDGVTLGATVHGEGPPLVFWHGAYGDGDLDWRGLLPYLAQRFTCHKPSWRGRGFSQDHPDLSYTRRIDDVIDYVDSLDEPTGLVGWSGGANPALAAAGLTDAVSAVALIEPTMGSIMDEHERATFGAAIASLSELAAEGRMTDALRAAAEFPFSAEEIALANASGYFESAARYVPNLLGVFRQLREHTGPTVDDPPVLEAISTPVLVLVGAETKPFWLRSAQHVVDHVPNARTEQIAAAGHAALITHPAELAEALTRFFSRG